MYSLYNFLIEQEGKTAQIKEIFVLTVCAVLIEHRRENPLLQVGECQLF